MDYPRPVYVSLPATMSTRARYRPWFRDTFVAGPPPEAAKWASWDWHPGIGALPALTKDGCSFAFDERPYVYARGPLMAWVGTATLT